MQPSIPNTWRRLLSFMGKKCEESMKCKLRLGTSLHISLPPWAINYTAIFSLHSWLTTKLPLQLVALRAREAQLLNFSRFSLWTT